MEMVNEELVKKQEYITYIGHFPVEFRLCSNLKQHEDGSYYCESGICENWQNITGLCITTELREIGLGLFKHREPKQAEKESGPLNRGDEEPNRTIGGEEEYCSSQPTHYNRDIPPANSSPSKGRETPCISSVNKPLKEALS